MKTEIALVQQYAALIQTYAILAEDGALVGEKVEGAVGRACAHFRLTHVASAETCLNLFREELNQHLSKIGSQQRQSKAVLESALALLPATI